MADISPRKYDLLILAAGIIAAAIHVYSFYPFYIDDAFISLRYARRLIDGHGLTWTDGPPVEGYSNLLWTLACALLGRLGMDLIVATRVLGALSVLAVFAALLYHRRTAGTESAIPFAIGVAAFSLAAPVGAWTWAGLETPFVAAFLVWGVVLLVRSPLSSRACATAGVFFGLLSLTRPDGPLFTMVAAAWILFMPGMGDRRRNLLWFLIWPALLIGAQLAFRLAYYGEWVPNTYHVKVSPSLRHVVGGVKYVWWGMVGVMPASILALYGLGVIIRRDEQRRGAAVLVLAAIVAWLGYLVLVGGDIFPGRRHIVPFVALSSVGLMIVLEWVVTTYAWKKEWTTAVIAALCLCVVAQTVDRAYYKARYQKWIWNAEVVGRMLGGAFAEKQPVLAVIAAGGIPYWSKLPCIDMLGLSDKVIARAKLPDRGKNYIGHEQADANYVISRRPDLIHFGSPGGGEPVFGYKDQLQDIPVFWQDYALCAMGGFEPYPFISHIYVDRMSPKVGLVTTPGRVDVPLYFLEGTAAMWVADEKRFVARLDPGRPVGARAISLDTGQWQIGLPSGVEAQLVDSAKGNVLATRLNGESLIELDAPATVNVIMRVTGTQSVKIYSLVLTKR